MQQYKAVFEQDGEWFIGFCPEVPEANGQGKTLEECRKNLADAIKLVNEDKLNDYIVRSNRTFSFDTVTVE
ncbi:MAG: type II toxin-antitoxin system HicB family antitoxin [bacterium]